MYESTVHISTGTKSTLELRVTCKWRGGGRGKLALSCLRDKLIMLVRDSFVLKIFILQVTAESSTVSFICPPEN